MRHWSILAMAFVALPSLVTAQTLGDASTESPPIAADPGPLPYGLFVSPAISTLGVGLEAGMRINETFGVRFGGNWLSFNVDRTVDGIDYNADARLASLGALADYHPFQGGFRLSGGVRFNFNKADLTSTPDRAVTIGNVSFSPAELGTLNGDATFNPIAPYLGIGYGGTLLSGALSIGFDLGVMYQGSAKVDLSAQNGLLQDSTVLQDNLAIEEQNIEDDLKEFVLYPVVGLAMIYRF